MSRPAVRAVILAGGFGTRIRHVLPDRPKPMALVAGRPFVEWILRYLHEGGVKDFVLSSGYRAEVIADYFAAHPLAGTRIVCVPEGMPLGTAGGFINCTATDAPPDIWFVTNGDSLVFSPPRVLLDALRDPGVDAAVLGLPMEDASRYGTLRVDNQGVLRGFCEKQPGAGLINAGVYVFRHQLLAEFPSVRPLSFEADVFPGLLQKHRIAVVASASPFLDIGTESSLSEADSFIRRNSAQFAATFPSP